MHIREDLWYNLCYTKPADPINIHQAFYDSLTVYLSGGINEYKNKIMTLLALSAGGAAATAPL